MPSLSPSIKWIKLMELHGTISHIFFQSPDGDFAIAVVDTAEGDEWTIKGSLPGIRKGAVVDVKGRIVEHDVYGEQIDVDEMIQTVPQTIEGISGFLQGVDGVGPAYASRLAEHIASMDSPEKDDIAACDGVPDKVAKLAAAAWSDGVVARKAKVALRGMGLSANQAQKAYDEWQGRAPSIVENQPYLMTELPGIGFKIADKIATTHLGVKKDDPHRQKAGIMYALENSAQQGHMGLPQKTLLTLAAEELDMPRDHLSTPMGWLIDDGDIVECNDILQTSSAKDAELDAARHIHRIASHQNEDQNPQAIDLPDELTDQQARAVNETLTGGVIALTGGPGVGKTYTTRAIIEAWASVFDTKKKCCTECGGHGCDDCSGRGHVSDGYPIYLCAPTGKAAKRLSDVSGARASTVHRLLGAVPTGHGFTWKVQPEGLKGLVIIDEASMVDTYMLRTLLSRISKKSTVVFVGDPDQLPSVGPGYTLFDIKNSECVASVHLDRVHRQAQGSGIVRFAYEVQQGHCNINPTDDFSPVEVASSQAAEHAVIACYDRLDELGFDIRNDVQTVTPMKAKGRAATAYELNNRIQRKLYTPELPHITLGDRRFFVTDRVMQTKNDYDRSVFNGDVGTVRWIDPHAQKGEPAITVEFSGDHTVEYDHKSALQLRRSYACTVHKSQGSEYPVVIVVVASSHIFMLERTLIYTAITRASERAILVYEPRALRHAIATNPSRNRHRNLAHHLHLAKKGTP